MSENLLGKDTPLVERYAPELLYAIPRTEGRNSLGLGAQLPFLGEDVWHAWELSWLNGNGLPEVEVGRFHFPSDSPNIVESKSFKLYLNSLNQHTFGERQELLATLERDLAAVAGAKVGVDLLSLDSEQLKVGGLPGNCVDGLQAAKVNAEPDFSVLTPTDGEGGQWHSHLLRSLCPVTAQPDWGSVVVAMSGACVSAESLLSYLLAFRNHQEFHEQCVERIFTDIQKAIGPAQLSVQALYTRRGGLDISPWRSTDNSSAPVRRTSRQ